VSPKKKSMGQGKTSLIGNLTASMPWLKNKTFFIPALASVLVVSLVGVVLAVQATNTPTADQESAEVSLEESNPEAEEQPAIGFYCVKGTVVCEEVKSILLDTDYEEVLTKWTRQSLIQHLVDTQYVSVKFATEVVDAVRFDWGDGSTYAGSATGNSGSGNSTGSGSGSAASSIPCAGAARICAFLKEIYGLGQFDEFIKEDLVSYIVRTYKVTEAAAEATVDSTGYIWGDRGLPELQRAAKNLTRDAETMSRIQVAEYMRDYIGLGYSESLAAIDALGINWNLKAKKVVEEFASQGPFSARYMWSVLVQQDFLAEEATYAVDSLDIDWYQQAERMVFRILSAQTPPCEFTYDGFMDVMIEDEGFFPDEAQWGILSYLEIDENYNDVWLVCGPQ
jgi:hypothetical protein